MVYLGELNWTVELKKRLPVIAVTGNDWGRVKKKKWGVDRPEAEKRVKLHNNEITGSRGWILSLNTQGKGEVGWAN